MYKKDWVEIPNKSRIVWNVTDNKNNTNSRPLYASPIKIYILWPNPSYIFGFIQFSPIYWRKFKEKAFSNDVSMVTNAFYPSKSRVQQNDSVQYHPIITVALDSIWRNLIDPCDLPRTFEISVHLKEHQYLMFWDDNYVILPTLLIVFLFRLATSII